MKPKREKHATPPIDFEKGLRGFEVEVEVAAVNRFEAVKDEALQNCDWNDLKKDIEFVLARCVERKS